MSGVDGPRRFSSAWNSAITIVPARGECREYALQQPFGSALHLRYGDMAERGDG